MWFAHLFEVCFIITFFPPHISSHHPWAIPLELRKETIFLFPDRNEKCQGNIHGIQSSEGTSCRMEKSDMIILREPSLISYQRLDKSTQLLLYSWHPTLVEFFALHKVAFYFDFHVSLLVDNLCFMSQLFMAYYAYFVIFCLSMLALLSTQLSVMTNIILNTMLIRCASLYSQRQFELFNINWLIDAHCLLALLPWQPASITKGILYIQGSPTSKFQLVSRWKKSAVLSSDIFKRDLRLLSCCQK